jgi:hypothetical protein
MEASDDWESVSLPHSEPPPELTHEGEFVCARAAEREYLGCPVPVAAYGLWGGY